MKKGTLLFLFLIVSIISCQREEDKSYDKAISSISDILNRDGVNIYISKEPLKPSTEIGTLGETFTSPNSECWFVFVDLHPFANWAHPCKYIFIDAKTDKLVELDKNFPPDCFGEMDVIKEVKVEAKGELLDFSNIKPTRAADNTNNLWAVIISGGGSPQSNHVRYWNDCSAMYNILIKKYGYKKENIYVIMADGTDPSPDRRLLDGSIDSSPLDLDGDGIPDIQYAATYSNVSSIFNNLANTLNGNDELFIFTTDHGVKVGDNSAIVLWNNQGMFDYEFASLVKRIKAKSINIVMEQCYSGGFVDYFKGNKNIIISTACTSIQLSYAREDLLYNEFVYHWMSAALEKDISTSNFVDSDDNRDGNISAFDCFRYAQKMDKLKETPQYLSIPEILGEKLTLTGVKTSQAKKRSYNIRLSEQTLSGKEVIPQGWNYYVRIPQNSFSGWFLPDQNISGTVTSDSYIEIEISIPYAYFPNYPEQYMYQPPIIYRVGAGYYSQFYDRDWMMEVIRYKINGIDEKDVNIGLSFYDHYGRERE